MYPLLRNISNVGETDPILNEKNQMYDVLLEFRCPDIWLVRSSKSNTTVTSESLKHLQVKDPSKSCATKPVIEDGEIVQASEVVPDTK